MKDVTYNPDTGLFTRDGKPIGGVERPIGYIQMNINGQRWRGHRLAWFLMTGTMPRSIDHINGDKADNRWANLREVDHITNMRNQKQRSTNTSGVTGVTWHKQTGKWHAQIHPSGKHVSLGLHDNLLDAAAARKSAELRYGFHTNHGRVT